MTRETRVRLAVLAILCGAAGAQVDRAALAKRHQEAVDALPAAQTKAMAATDAARRAIGDPDNRLQGRVDEVAMKLGGMEFDAAIGAQRLALDQLESAPEATRAATETALRALGDELQRGSTAVAAADALGELVARLAQLDAALAETQDCTSPLRDLAATAAKVRRAAALPKAEIAGLNVTLAQAQSKQRQRTAAEQVAAAQEVVEQLTRDTAALHAEMRSEDASTRDSGFAKFDDGAQRVVAALAQVPATDPSATPLRQRWQKLAAEADAIYTTVFGAATLERVRAAYDFTASSFEGWESESANIAAADYLNLDGSNLDQLGHPRTAELLNRTNRWFAYFGVDDGYLRAGAFPALRDYVAANDKARATALARLVGVATGVVDALAASPPADERARDRVAVLADWDLRNLLQDSAQQWALVDRLHRVLDAYDGKALGAAGRLAKARSDAVAAAEANWTRMLQTLPILGGFEPSLAGKFAGRLVQLLDVRDRRAEFDGTDADLVFDLDGVVFAASYAPPVKARLALEQARLELPPVATESLELLAVVEGEASLRLLGPGGAKDGIDVPCRRLRVIGLRGGAIAFAQR